MPTGSHTELGQLLRTEVARKVLNDSEYSSLAGTLPVLNKWTNEWEAGFRDYNKSYDLVDAARSRVMTLDTKETFGKIHPYLITPLSGSFPWAEINTLPACNSTQIKNIQSSFNYSVKFAFDAAMIFQNVELIDACQSNSFFSHTQKALFLGNQTEDCHQMVDRRAKSKVSPFRQIT